MVCKIRENTTICPVSVDKTCLAMSKEFFRKNCRSFMNIYGIRWQFWFGDGASSDGYFFLRTFQTANNWIRKTGGIFLSCQRGHLFDGFTCADTACSGDFMYIELPFNKRNLADLRLFGETGKLYNVF